MEKAPPAGTGRASRVKKYIGDYSWDTIVYIIISLLERET